MKLSIHTGLAIAVGAALLFVAAGCSKTGRNETAADRGTGNPPGQSDRNTNNLSSDDRDFAAKAAQGGMAEVEMGNLAQQQGTSSQLKEYGRTLVEDHTKLNNDLKDLAAKENIMLPSEVSSDERKTIDRLSKLSGPEFDKEFAKESVSDHKKDIDEFSKQAKSGQDEGLKTFAANSIPVLEKHLTMAENVEQGKTVTSRK